MIHAGGITYDVLIHTKEQRYDMVENNFKRPSIFDGYRYLFPRSPSIYIYMYLLIFFLIDRYSNKKVQFVGVI